MFRYLYADLYGGAIWAGIEVPENSGNYTSTMIPFSCAKNSPIPCDTAAGSHLPSLGFIYSFGEDNSKDVFLLISVGVYRIVPPSRCNYACPKENTTDCCKSSSWPVDQLSGGEEGGGLIADLEMKAALSPLHVRSPAIMVDRKWIVPLAVGATVSLVLLLFLTTLSSPDAPLALLPLSL
ncbi:hypothetical protein B296_00043878, partial [Ensete ventricosum]